MSTANVINKRPLFDTLINKPNDFFGFTLPDSLKASVAQLMLHCDNSAQRQLEMGGYLATIRRHLPYGKFGPFLKKIKLSHRRAHALMVANYQFSAPQFSPLVARLSYLQLIALKALDSKQLSILANNQRLYGQDLSTMSDMQPLQILQWLNGENLGGQYA